MTSWNAKKQGFSDRYNTLSNYFQNELTTDASGFNDSMTKFINNGGVSNSSDINVDASGAIVAFNKILQKKSELRTLNNDIVGEIKTISTDEDTGNMLLQNGNLQQEIHELEKQKDVSRKDADTALNREKTLRLQDKNITAHQLFLIKNPVSKSLIPYLWAISVIFVAIGVLIFKKTLPPIPTAGTLSVSLPFFGTFWLFFQTAIKDVRIWVALSAALIIVIIFLSLKIVNVI